MTPFRQMLRAFVLLDSPPIQHERRSGSPTSHSSNSTGALVGGILGGLAIVTIAVFAALLLRMRARRKYLKAASAQFIQRHLFAPNSLPPAPDIRRASIHKQRPPPPRYMPSLSVVSEPRSMGSYDPASTIRILAREGRSPLHSYYESTTYGYGSNRDIGYNPRNTQLTADNLRELTRLETMWVIHTLSGLF